jgi:hypothetical protein
MIVHAHAFTTRKCAFGCGGRVFSHALARRYTDSCADNRTCYAVLTHRQCSIASLRHTRKSLSAMHTVRAIQAIARFDQPSTEGEVYEGVHTA